MNSQNSNITVGYISVILAGFSFGSITVLSALLRNAGASSIEQTFIRLGIGAGFGVIVLTYTFLRGKNSIKNSLSIKIQLTYIIQGILFTAMILAILSAIALSTPVGEAALLVQIQPVFTVILGAIFLNEAITRIKISSLIIAIIGLFLITTPWKWDSFLSSLTGDLLALFDGFCYALYLLIGRWSNKLRLNISASISISWVLIWGFLTGLPIISLITFLPLPPSINLLSLPTIFMFDIFILGVLLALFGSIIPYSLIMISNRYDVESSKQGILLLGDPIGAIILGAIILSEPITIWYIIGGTALLTSILFLYLLEKE